MGIIASGLSIHQHIASASDDQPIVLKLSSDLKTLTWKEQQISSRGGAHVLKSGRLFLGDSISGQYERLPQPDGLDLFIRHGSRNALTLRKNLPGTILSGMLSIPQDGVFHFSGKMSADYRLLLHSNSLERLQQHILRPLDGNVVQLQTNELANGGQPTIAHNSIIVPSRDGDTLYTQLDNGKFSEAHRADHLHAQLLQNESLLLAASTDNGFYIPIDHEGRHRGLKIFGQRRSNYPFNLPAMRLWVGEGRLYASMRIDQHDKALSTQELNRNKTSTQHLRTSIAKIRWPVNDGPFAELPESWPRHMATHVLFEIVDAIDTKTGGTQQRKRVKGKIAAVGVSSGKIRSDGGNQPRFYGLHSAVGSPARLTAVGNPETHINVVQHPVNKQSNAR